MCFQIFSKASDQGIGDRYRRSLMSGKEFMAKLCFGKDHDYFNLSRFGTGDPKSFYGQQEDLGLTQDSIELVTILTVQGFELGILSILMDTTYLRMIEGFSSSSLSQFRFISVQQGSLLVSDCVTGFLKWEILFLCYIFQIWAWYIDLLKDQYYYSVWYYNT